MVRPDLMNELIESTRDPTDLYVVFSNRGCGKNAVSKLIKGVNFIEQIFKTELKVYYDKDLIHRCAIVIVGTINDCEIKIIIDSNAFNMPLNEFICKLAYKFTEEVKNKIFTQEIKRKKVN